MRSRIGFGRNGWGSVPNFRETPIQEIENYWSKRPCNLFHSKSVVGSPKYFKELDDRKLLVEPHIPEFAQFRTWAGKRVLEVGCGLGGDTARFVRAGALVTAVDLSTESLRIARMRPEMDSGEVQLFQGDAEQLSSVVQTRDYDLVYSFGAIHHSPHPERIVREMRKLVADTGICKIMVYNRFSWKAMKLVKGRFWAFDRWVAKQSEAESGCPVTYSYSKRSAKRLLELQGFKVIDIEVDHIFPYRVKDYVEYRYVKTFLIRLIPKRVFRSLERTFGWHLMITAIPC